MNDIRKWWRSYKRSGRRVIVGGLCAWLGACAINTPFRGPGYDSREGITLQLDAEATVVVGLTKAIIGGDREKNKDFDRNLWQLVDSMNRQSGLIGYSVRKQIFGDELWTMTVWQDEASLIAFVQSGEHTRAVQEGDAALTGSLFARLRMKGADIPLSWERATELIDLYGQPYPRPPGELIDLRTKQ